MDDQDYDKYLTQLSHSNLREGVLYEPRIYWDRIELDAQTIQQGEAGIFRNGENFPVVITHAMMSVAHLTQGDSVSDERLIQRIGMYMEFHDQYYMNPPQQIPGAFTVRAAPVPTWSNVLTNTANVVSEGTATMRFKRPFILSVRDSLDIEASVVDTIDNSISGGIVVSVTFSGVGIKSHQPYFMTGNATITQATAVNLPIDAYVNDGAEPILVRDMTIAVTGELADQADIAGDARRIGLRVRQIGNGTGAQWVTGPQNVAGVPGHCPAILWGNYGGRAVVHQFPKPKIWKPGEGLTVSAQGLTDAVGNNQRLFVALCGYIAVT